MNYDVVEQHTKLDKAIYVFVTNADTKLQLF